MRVFWLPVMVISLLSCTTRPVDDTAPVQKQSVAAATPPTSPTSAPPVSFAADTRLYGKRWTIVSINGSTIATEGLWIEFTEAGSFNGFDGCNRQWGQFVRRGAGIEIVRFATNQETCAGFAPQGKRAGAAIAQSSPQREVEIRDLEKNFYIVKTALTGALGYRFDEGRLTVTAKGASVVLTAAQR